MQAHPLVGAPMRVWQLDGPGNGRLQLAQRAIPAPGAHELLVRVDAVALNYRDKLMLENGLGETPERPFIPCSDMAGEVVAIGAGVTRFRPGARIVSTFFAGWVDGAYGGQAALGGAHQTGMLAEYVVLNQEWAASAPATLTAAQASTLPCAGLTAWQALIELDGGLHAGDRVLIAGSGGVALFGLQFARAHGAEVFLISASEEKRARASALGAAHGIAREADWAHAVMEHSAGQGVDIVLETAGGASLGRSLATLAQGGRIALIGLLDGSELRTSVFPLLLRRATLQGVSVGPRCALERMIRAIDLNGIVPVIDREYAFEQAAEAFAHLDRGPFGKVVLRVGHD